MHYYTHNIGEFASMTRLLDPQGVGIAIMIIDEYARTEKPITSEWLANGFDSLPDGKLERVLSLCFEREGDGYVFAPIRDQIESYQKRAEVNRINASKPRKKKTVAVEAQAKETTSNDSLFENERIASESLATNNHKPLTNEQSVHGEIASEKKAKKRTRLTLETLPEEWAAYVRQIDDQLDPNAIWDNFLNYWTNLADKPLARDWKQVWEVNARKVRDDPRLRAQFLRSEFKTTTVGRPKHKTFCQDDYEYHDY